jgi:hypothetical protein
MIREQKNPKSEGMPPFNPQGGKPPLNPHLSSFSSGGVRGVHPPGGFGARETGRSNCPPSSLGGVRGTRSNCPPPGKNLAFHQLAAMQMKLDIEKMIQQLAFRCGGNMEHGDKGERIVRLWEDGKITTIDEKKGSVVEIYPSINQGLRPGYELLPPVWMPKMTQSVQRKGRNIWFSWFDDVKAAAHIRKEMVKLCSMVVESNKEKENFLKKV